MVTDRFYLSKKHGQYSTQLDFFFFFTWRTDWANWIELNWIEFIWVPPHDSSHCSPPQPPPHTLYAHTLFISFVHTSITHTHTQHHHDRLHHTHTHTQFRSIEVVPRLIVPVLFLSALHDEMVPRTMMVDLYRGVSVRWFACLFVCLFVCLWMCVDVDVDETMMDNCSLLHSVRQCWGQYW